MILQALSTYYEKKKDELPPEGFQSVEIPFVIVIDRDGNFVQLRDTREGSKGRYFFVPRAGGRSGTSAWAKPNLLWDHYGFVVGHPKGNTDADRNMAVKQHRAFCKRVEEVASELPIHHSIQSVAKYLRCGEFVGLYESPGWGDCIKKLGCNLSFQVAGENFIVAEDPSLSRFILDTETLGDGNDVKTCGICLVTGDVDVIVRLHPEISGIGEKPAPLAAINNGKSPAFSSFGKSQGFNFPVGDKAAFAYATALRHLLRNGSKQKLRIADAVVTFWAEKPSGAEFESKFLDFINPPADDPDGSTQAVTALYSCVRDGKAFTDDDRQRFHILGLAPNAARIAVRFWHVATIEELGRAFHRYFRELDIARPAPDAGAPLSLFRLLTATALLGKAENIPPNLGADVMRAILTGGPYPETLMQGAMRRIRAERKVTWERAALLKAYLIRNQHKEITVSLDETTTDPGYRLGRLFAALERVQERAQGNLNASIRDRYYGAFSTTPVTVLPLLMKLKNHHLAKLPNRGEAVNLEKTLGRIIDGLDSVPPRLSLAGQAQLALGYYHQRQAFFTKADADSSENNAN